MNFNKGKLIRIEYGKVDRLKVYVEHIYKEEKDKAKMLIEIPENANETYYEYLLFRGNIYHIDKTSDTCIKKCISSNKVQVIFDLTKTPFGTDASHWEEMARIYSERINALERQVNSLKSEKEDILDKLREILEDN